MIELFFRGGPLMYPLLAGSLFMLAIIIERAFVFAGTGAGRDNFHAVLELIRASRTDQALDETGQCSSVTDRFLHETITGLDKPRDVLENELSIFGDGILNNLNRHLHILSLIGRIAPMVGLTGTVLGMVQAFYRVASVRGIVEASLLADGIWSALLTTVAGLFVAIPALIAHSLFENRIRSLAFRMKHYSEELIAVYQSTKHDRF
ncbi:MAG: MotA/TolQ/ExbB proton channel family protein [Spirochaetales bacterium]|nr:MotA/TolQ/ExbB proton channel family protein [Spirochaetales bacterium]